MLFLKNQNDHEPIPHFSKTIKKFCFILELHQLRLLLGSSSNSFFERIKAFRKYTVLQYTIQGLVIIQYAHRLFHEPN
jgi:hypothetical protein